MIKDYKDHTANERTFLAWIRLGIGIMAFGFVIQKFDLFVSYIGMQTHKEAFQPHRSAEFVGLSLMVVSVAVIIISTFRFFAQKKAIAAHDIEHYHGTWANLSVAVLIVLLFVFLIFYISHQVLSAG